MWFRIEGAVSPDAIAPVLDASKEIAAKIEDRHFVAEGKSFFTSAPKCSAPCTSTSMPISVWRTG